jgi:hypothetical protein
VLIAELLLQVAFEDLAAGTVGAAEVGEDEQFFRAGIVLPALAPPPVLDGIDRELGSLGVFTQTRQK